MCVTVKSFEALDIFLIFGRHNQKSLLPHKSVGKLNLQTMTDDGEFFSLEELAAEENLTLDPSACVNITAEYMLVGSH